MVSTMQMSPVQLGVDGTKYMKSVTSPRVAAGHPIKLMNNAVVRESPRVTSARQQVLMSSVPALPEVLSSVEHQPTARHLPGNTGASTIQQQHQPGFHTLEVHTQRETFLPAESSCWTRFEMDLYRMTDGQYNASLLARKRRIQMPKGGLVRGTGVSIEVPGRVSIVTPTMSSRQHHHEQLWACFDAQKWEDKELIVVETYADKPSPFLAQKAKEDSRLVHVVFKREEGQDWSVGLKRDMTLHLASGEFIANFDDDDIYASSYVTKMLGELRSKGLEAITLCSWYNYFTTTGECGYTDPPKAWQCPWYMMSKDNVEDVMYGYGFSYVHRRCVALAFPYPDKVFAEDSPFLRKLKDTFGEHKVVLKKDTEGLCIHLVHKFNTSGDMPIERIVPLEEIAGLDVAPLFQSYLNKQVITLDHLYHSVVSRLNLAVESLQKLFPSGAGLHSSLTHRRVKSC